MSKGREEIAAALAASRDQQMAAVRKFMGENREALVALAATEKDADPEAMPSVEACLTALQELVVWEDGRWMCGEADVTETIGALLPCPETDRERAERLALYAERIAARCTEQDRLLDNAGAEIRNQRLRIAELQERLQQTVTMMKDRDEMVEKAEKAMADREAFVSEVVAAPLIINADIANLKNSHADYTDYLKDRLAKADNDLVILQSDARVKDRQIEGLQGDIERLKRDVVGRLREELADAHAVIDQRNQWIATQDAVIKELRSDVENMRIALGVPVEPVDAPHRMFTGESDYSPDGRPGVPCGSEG